MFQWLTFASHAVDHRARWILGRSIRSASVKPFPRHRILGPLKWCPNLSRRYCWVRNRANLLEPSLEIEYRLCRRVALGVIPSSNPTKRHRCFWTSTVYMYSKNCMKNWVSDLMVAIKMITTRIRFIYRIFFIWVKWPVIKRCLYFRSWLSVATRICSHSSVLCSLQSEVRVFIRISFQSLGAWMVGKSI